MSRTDKSLDGLDEILNRFHKFIENKDEQENEVNIRGFYLGTPLQDLLNELKKKGRNPTLREIIDALGKRKLEDFAVLSEFIPNAALISRLDRDDIEITAYIQYIRGDKKVVVSNMREDEKVVASIIIVGLDKKEYDLYKLVLYVSTDESSPNSEYKVWGRSFTMIARPDHPPDYYAKYDPFNMVLCFTDLSLKEGLKLGLGLGNVTFNKGDFSPTASSQVYLSREIVNLAASLRRGQMEVYKKNISNKPSMCEKYQLVS
ncbi:MAG: hypothetical protein QXJ93_01830 [Candidatus Rehaiarchaeum fermentans]|nr:hypothetical protein [Candidatus Rehaiarchaeum fermentans]